MNRRDWLLQEMGITQWQLRRPETLQGLVNIPVSNNIRLVVISETTLEMNDPFLVDILRSIELQESECLLTDFDHIQHLNISHFVHYWLLSKNQEKKRRICEQLNTSPHRLWQTETLQILKGNATEKRELWRQIQQSFTQSV